jgi:hypothetical protein
MDRTGRSIIIKFIMTFIFAFIALGLVRSNVLNWIILVSLAVTAMNYLLGDILILPSFGNTVASVADGLSAMLVAHIIGIVVLGLRTSLLSLLLFGTLITIGEYVFHRRILDSRT